MAEERWRGGLLVASVALLIYLNSVPGEFVFDDHEAIEANHDVRSDTPLSVLLSHDFWGYPLASNESHKSFRPLATLSFRWNRQMHGMWAPGFHLVNVLLHALVSCLYFVFCSRLLQTYWVSIFAALLFAMHPIHTEAVANVVGRTELLCAVFFLLSLLTYQCVSPAWPMRDGKQSSFAAAKVVWFLLSLIFSVLSLLSKEQGITVLSVCVAYEVFIVMNSDLLDCLKVITHFVGVLRRDAPTTLSKSKSSLKRILALIISALIFLCARLYINGEGSPLFVESDNPASFSTHWLTKTLTYLYLCGLNAWLLLFPSRLCFDWSMGSIPLVETLTDPRNALTMASLLTLYLLLLHKGGVFSRNWHKLCRSHDDCGDNDFINTVTTGTNSNANNNNSNSNSNNNSNNNNTSNGSFSVSAILACGTEVRTASKKTKLRVWPRRSSCRRHGHHQLVLLAVSLFALSFLPASNLLFPVGFVVAERVLYIPSMGTCLLIAMGAKRLHEWSRLTNSATLKAAVRILACITMATHASKTLMRNYNWWNTQALAESALPVNPSNAKVFVTIGNVYAQQGARKCELFYREAIRLRPTYTNAWTNLGLVLLNTERPEGAERCYRRALSIKPDHINANTNMGHLCRLQHRWGEASRYYRVALSRRPDNPTLLYNLGVVLERIGHPSNVTESETLFRRCVKLFPSHTDAIFALARLLGNTTSSGEHVWNGYSTENRIKESVQMYRLGLRQQMNPQAHYELGKLLLLKNELQEAEKELSLAVKLAPKLARAHYALGNTLKALGENDRAADHHRLAKKLEQNLDKPSDSQHRQ